MRRSGQSGLAVLGLASAVLGGCGGGEGSVAAAPTECLESWNAGSTSQSYGRHIYNTHETRRAQVAMLKPVGPDSNVARAGACAVIFAVPETDAEYGDAGLVMTDFGWASMRELARTDQAALDQIQGDASASANATVFPDGRLEPN